jgi:hypothetical protein
MRLSVIVSAAIVVLRSSPDAGKGEVFNVLKRHWLRVNTF